jgi:hypothetical protein
MRFWRSTGVAARENILDPIGERIESEGRDAKEALRNDQQFLAQEFELQLLSQKRGREVSCRPHQQDQISQSLITQNSNIFQTIALFDEAESFFNFPSGQIDLHDPLERL